MAATWAAMINHGMDGYVKATKEIVSTMKFLEAGCVSLMEIMNNLTSITKLDDISKAQITRRIF